MSLDDEIRQRKAELQRKEQLERAWEDSPFSRDSPIVEQPTGPLADLIREVLPQLRFDYRYYRGISPDGIERVTNNKQIGEWVGFINRRKEYREVTNTNGELVILRDEKGKVPYQIDYEDSAAAVVILPDGKLFKLRHQAHPFLDLWPLYDSFVTTEFIRTALITHLAMNY